MQRIFLIDAMSHIFRAFYAPMSGRVEPLKNSRGQVTQAIFVFTNVLRKLLSDQKPEYITAVFESEVPTFRHTAYADYKANRAVMPDELRSQIPYIMRVCEAFHVPIISVDSFEADDCIGTLATRVAGLKDPELQAIIVSNDKDMCQLVRDPRIICMRHNSQSVKRKTPVPPIEWCDEAWVEKKFEVPASQIVDLLGLMGDSSDNIPGAPGVGPKGAVQIIKQFGSIENALEHCEEIKHKSYRESLKNNIELIRQSRELATIRTDVPIDLNLEQLCTQPPDAGAAFALFEELEFQALKREFAHGAAQVRMGTSTEPPAEAAFEIKNISTLTEVESLVKKLDASATIALSVAVPLAVSETEEAGTTNLPCIAIAIPNSKDSAPNSISVDTIDLNSLGDEASAAVKLLASLLAKKEVTKIVHDLKQIMRLLAPLDIVVNNVVDDTLLAAYLLDPTRSDEYPLIALARDYVGNTGGLESIESTENNWNVDSDSAALFKDALAKSAVLVMRTAAALRPLVRDRGVEKVYRDIELPLVPVLYQMERVGLRVDAQVLKSLSGLFSEELGRLTTKIHELAGREFNIGSPKQVGEIFEELNITTGRKTSTGRVSTSRAVLDELAGRYELPRLIIEYREIDKLKSVYADALPTQIGPDGRIHSQLNQTVAATGRLSSSNPNLQNIPIRTELGRRIRSAFIPASGCKLIAADYSQLELRILAHISRDPVMLDAFQKGEDIHARTARLVFNAQTESELKEKRRLAKIVNFAIAYAVEPFGLSMRVGITRKEAKKVIEDYFDTYIGVRRYMEETPERARETGYVRSIFGRMRPMPALNDRNGQIRARAEREAINMPIQGTASDIVKIAMLRVDGALREQKLEAQMIMQIHDELLVEAPESEINDVIEILKREMESAAQLDVPLEVNIGVGVNWMDAK